MRECALSLAFLCYTELFNYLTLGIFKLAACMTFNHKERKNNSCGFSEPTCRNHATRSLLQKLDFEAVRFIPQGLVKHAAMFHICLLSLFMK